MNQLAFLKNSICSGPRNPREIHPINSAVGCGIGITFLRCSIHGTRKSGPCVTKRNTIQFPPCASRRTIGSSSEMYFCTHPDVHIPRHIVTPSICRRCPVCNSVPPEKFLSFPFTGASLSRPAELQLVVAHYREDLSWLEDFSVLPVTVYSKGGTGPNELPNVGREAHTYLHHIIENYDSLADVTVFLQGDPRDHVPDVFEKIWSVDSRTQYRELSDLMLVDDALGRPPQPGLPLATFYERLFEAAAPEYYCCRVGACFAVSRDNIRQRSLDFYRRALNLVLTEDRGPWCIERLWHFIFQTKSESEGIVTAADSGYFRDLQFLVRSVRSVSNRPICVIDLGLSETQRHWCLDIGHVLLWAPPELYQPMQRIRERFWWQAWIKPYYLVQAPFDRVLWIDADCVVLQPLDDAFEHIRNSPLLVRDGTTVVTENDPRLYDHLPLPEGVVTSGVNVNSGVVGICKVRDRNILSAWAWAAQWLAMNPHLQSFSAWADQGLLLWALHHTGMTHHICQKLTFNQPIFQEPTLLSGAICNGLSLLKEFRERSPESVILQFLGPHKLSKQLDDQIQKVFF